MPRNNPRESISQMRGESCLSVPEATATERPSPRPAVQVRVRRAQEATDEMWLHPQILVLMNHVLVRVSALLLECCEDEHIERRQ